MIIGKLLLFFVLKLCSFCCNLASTENESNTLVLLHVLFRHGDRTPNLKEVYPKDPYINYTYPPLGYGQLTEAGKLKEFLIGKALKKKYGVLLGKLTPNEIVATTTDYERTKLSCQLVLAGLYSLQEQEQDANIPKNSECHFQKKEKDEFLGDPLRFCPEFRELYNEQATKLKGLEFYNNNREFYNYILNNTGWTDPTPHVSSELYYLLKSQEMLGLKLPDWTRSIWPSALNIRAADESYVYTETTKMKRIAGGYLLKKILDDTEHTIKTQQHSNTKLFLYSGHDFNVAFMLILLDQFSPHIPPYGAYITFEVHNIKGVYGFKIFYQDYSTNHEKLPFDLKGCGRFCPIENFTTLFLKYFPTSGDCVA